MERTLPRPMWAIVMLVGAAVGAFAMVNTHLTYLCHGCDHMTYAAVAGRIISGDPIYPAFQMAPHAFTDVSWGRGWVYPPTSAVILGGLASVPLEAWRLINVVALILAVRLVLGPHVAMPWLVATTTVLLFPPTWDAWTNGQVTPLLVLAFGLAYAYPRRAWAMAAFGAAVKLFPLVLFAWVLRERGWRHIAYGLAALLGIVLVTLPLTGVESWPAFVVAVRNVEPNCWYQPVNSLRCTFGDAGQVLGLGLAGLLALAALAIRDRSVAFLLLTLTVPVASPDLNGPYWLLPLLGMAGAVSRITAEREWGPNIIFSRGTSAGRS